MLTELLSATRTLGTRLDDDYIDRMHYFLTSNICIVLSILVSFKQFNGKPMECIIPSRFDDSFEDYAENYCWSERTYHYPFEKLGVKVDKSERYEHMIGYYQWVPFYLLFVAAFFRVPSILWRLLAGHSGMNINEIVKLAATSENIEHEVRKENLKSLTMHLQSALRFHRRAVRRHIHPHKVLAPLNLPYTAFFVCSMYVITKLLYLSNVILQLVFLNQFLPLADDDFIGFDAVRKIFTRPDWEDNSIFPRVTLCDFKVRATGSNVQDYTVQCVLVINMFNEKIFVFLWCWFVLLILMTFLSIISWSIVTLVPTFSRSFISRHLELSDLAFDPESSEKDVERFVSGYLKKDGVFILRMIKSHAGIIFATDLVLSLWQVFYGLEDIRNRHAPSYLTPTPPVLPSAPGYFEDQSPHKHFFPTSSLKKLKHRSVTDPTIMQKSKKVAEKPTQAAVEEGSDEENENNTIELRKSKSVPKSVKSATKDSPSVQSLESLENDETEAKSSTDTDKLLTPKKGEMKSFSAKKTTV